MPSFFRTSPVSNKRQQQNRKIGGSLTTHHSSSTGGTAVGVTSVYGGGSTMGTVVVLVMAACFVAVYITLFWHSVATTPTVSQQQQAAYIQLQEQYRLDNAHNNRLRGADLPPPKVDLLQFGAPVDTDTDTGAKHQYQQQQQQRLAKMQENQQDNQEGMEMQAETEAATEVAGGDKEGAGLTEDPVAAVEGDESVTESPNEEDQEGEDEAGEGGNDDGDDDDKVDTTEQEQQQDEEIIGAQGEEKPMDSQRLVHNDSSNNAKEVVHLRTELGVIRIVLQPQFSATSVQYVKDFVAATQQACLGCRLYRVEKEGIVQGVMPPLTGAAVGSDAALKMPRLDSITKGSCPPGYETIANNCPPWDTGCGCHGPVMTRGMVAWAAGQTGPDFFFGLYKNPATHWGTQHTVWGEIDPADADSYAVIDRVFAQPYRKQSDMTLLEQPLHFTLELTTGDGDGGNAMASR